MKFLLDELKAQQEGGESVYALSAVQRSYGCKCKRAVFFGNSHCLSCDTPLGYEPKIGQVFALSRGPVLNNWQITGPHIPENHLTLYRRCQNAYNAAGCNWLVKVEESDPAEQPYCLSCRLNRTIPDLSFPENAVLWGRLEDAKRRVIATLVDLGLPVASRVSEDPQRGLAFDFLRSPASGPPVLTGHNHGLITLNIEEADNGKREQIRAFMHEPYRTLVGHFRHEVGHYYWDRLVAKTHWLDEFRTLFGDERADYNAALRKNYLQGPEQGWANRYVSAYASIHPWEDWAETWAHYMHMVDTLGTAISFGIKPESIAMPFDCFGNEALCDPQRADSERFLSFLNSWQKLTAVMNELCRSMGQPDFYPFVLPGAAVTKLDFVHLVVYEASPRCSHA
jgi:hypothetical protein